jgi:uncharacterized protein (TIGR00369 family)
MSYTMVDSLLEQLKAGELRDPISSLMNMRLVDYGRGEAVFELPLRPELGNGLGVVQGGVASVVADVAMAMAMTSTQDDEQFPTSALTTVDLFARFIRPVMVTSGVLRAEAKVIQSGSRLAWAECDLLAGDRTVGKFTATGMRITFKAQDIQRSASSADIASVSSAE